MIRSKQRDPLELISLRQLRYFSAAMQSESFNEAARTCSISQPALSEQIASLEDVLQQKLFDRGSGRARPTHHAYQLFQQISACLGDLQAALRATLNHSQAIGGQVRIGLVQSYGECWVLPVVREAQACWPELSIVLRRCSAQALIDGVLRGDFDMAVTFDPDPYPELEVARCFCEPLVAIGSKSHAGDGVSLKTLGGEKLALLPSGYTMRRQIDAAFAKAGVKPRIYLESDVLSDLAEATRNNNLVAIVNAASALSLGLVGQAHPILASGLCRTACVIRSAKRFQTSASAYLWDVLQQQTPVFPPSMSVAKWTSPS